MLNKAILIGRITKDLELKMSVNGNSYINFTLAVNGFKKEDVNFITCKAFNKKAETMANYLGKGSLIAIEGSIVTGSYENMQGQKVYTTDVFVNDFNFLQSKSENQANRNEQGSNDGTFVNDFGNDFFNNVNPFK